MRQKTNSYKHISDMKKVLYLVSFFAVLVFGVTACDDGFTELNTDETALNRIESVLQLNAAIAASGILADQIRCEASITKQQMRIFTGVGACGNFNVDASGDASNANWNAGYLTRLKNVNDAMTKTDPNSNLYQMLRIWRALSFMILTDSYGDIPYKEASAGFSLGIVFPNYDRQEQIYTGQDGILRELQAAAAALDPSKPTDTRDLLYNGDVNRWRRLANSLLLRGGMRLTKVNPTLARTYVQSAVSGGLMIGNADNAILRHTADYPNNEGVRANGGNSHFQYLVADFVNHLKSTNDPRLASIAVRYPTATSSTGQTAANADRNPQNQIGMPMGYDNVSIAPIATAAGLPSFYAYSQVDRTRMAAQNAPSFIATYGLQQLLMAEAAHRGWVSGSAATFYEQGIRAHMEQLAEYGAATAVPAAAITTYIQNNPLVAGRELEQINTQYWIASYHMPTETFANFRRSGFPVLTPNPLRGDLGAGETFMRRFGYPSTEKSLNENVKNGTNPDRIDTRVWWDVK
jgi:hypothetical protein